MPEVPIIVIQGTLMFKKYGLKEHRNPRNYIFRYLCIHRTPSYGSQEKQIDSIQISDYVVPSPFGCACRFGSIFLPIVTGKHNSNEQESDCDQENSDRLFESAASVDRPRRCPWESYCGCLKDLLLDNAREADLPQGAITILPKTISHNILKTKYAYFLTDISDQRG